MYNTLGFYVTCDDAVCKECANTLTDLAPEDQVNADYPWWGGFESWEAPLAITESDESNSPTHCAECNVVIPHELTADGYHGIIESVIDGFKAGKQNPVVVQWLDSYEEYMQAEDEYFDTEVGTIDYDDAMTLYRLLPHDTVWEMSDDERLRVHAYLAGWIEKV